ncbi:MAG: NADH:flavin oxidoreductase/NADH oxidase [Moraxellaceae bacterium]|nr:NADH:flavin oxidoreductase/NADH oxidase [Moraxellaceae bacterium]
MSQALLFTPLQLKDITLPNRIAVSPMCMYSCEDGLATDWHLVHLGSRASGGAGLVMAEATAVSPEGRISPDDLGLWDDRHIEPLARVTEFIRSQGAVASVQLAHAGRKASTWAPGKGNGEVTPAQGGWQVVAPSALRFSDSYPLPQALDADGIAKVIADFVAAARRALHAGFEVIEVHAAHGYLLHQFLSPLANQRSDAYGGSFENRVRLTREVVRAVRKAVPEQLPLLVRLSATDWAEAGGWDIEQTIALSRLLKEDGADLIDTTSGGMLAAPNIPLGPGYQTGFAARIRAEAGIATGAVGLITHAMQAEHILHTGQADMIFLARELLRDPYWPLHAASALHTTTSWPRQYLRGAPQGSTARAARSVD